jgi:hypothetical protein
MYRRMDVGASVNYCQRQLGRKATPARVQACVERRQDRQEIKDSSNGFFSGLLLGTMLDNH